MIKILRFQACLFLLGDRRKNSSRHTDDTGCINRCSGFPLNGAVLALVNRFVQHADLRVEGGLVSVESMLDQPPKTIALPLDPQGPIRYHCISG